MQYISAAHKKGNLVKYVLLIIACMLLLTCIALIWIRKYRGKVRNVLVFGLQLYCASVQKTFVSN
jgi:hypothetical protein